MKKLIFLSLLIFPIFASGQDTCRFQIGAGLGVGIFSPKDVNRYIDNYISSNNITISSGISDIFLNYFGHITTSYMFRSRFGVKAKFEMALGFKEIYFTNNIDPKNFYFWRFNPGVSGFYSIPVSDVMSISPEIGLNYHFMLFEGVKAHCLAPRVQVNLNFINNEIIRIEGLIGFDFAKATNTSNPKIKSLDYTGFLIGSGIFLAL